uniref:FAS1 domain-containing protein SELMODRAFT_448915-like n=1 Tax=Erigeron canadensis TaxID=72917 RepID=UPI001CB8D778|nr:FAS1 domain-containing protein SELMODRAFT_448915-like [Erigeron canadensis]
MSNYFPIFLFFTTVALTTPATISTDLHHLSPALSPLPPPPTTVPAPPEYMQQQQLKNILDALIGSGDFTSWLNLLLNPTNANTTTTIPSSATIFLPGNDAISSSAASSLIFDPFVIPYHILPHHFTFSDLQLFKTQTRIPTLLPSKTIIITNNSPHHFTIDDSLIIHPDLYSNDIVSVHGIDSILDYTVYGDAAQNPAVNLSPPPPPPPSLLRVDETPSPATPVVSSSSNGGCIVSRPGFLMHFLVTFFCLFSFGIY